MFLAVHDAMPDALQVAEELFCFKPVEQLIGSLGDIPGRNRHSAAGHQRQDNPEKAVRRADMPDGNMHQTTGLSVDAVDARLQTGRSRVDGKNNRFRHTKRD